MIYQRLSLDKDSVVIEIKGKHKKIIAFIKKKYLNNNREKAKQYLKYNKETSQKKAKDRCRTSSVEVKNKKIFLKNMNKN